MCYSCCCKSNISCSFHISAKQRRDEEQRLVEEGLLALTEKENEGKGKKKTKFYHFEERFMQSGETVTIFCLQDLCLVPSLGGEVFQAEERRRRRGARPLFTPGGKGPAFPRGHGGHGGGKGQPRARARGRFRRVSFFQFFSVFFSFVFFLFFISFICYLAVREMDCQ
jgi:hypothetical protein